MGALLWDSYEVQEIRSMRDVKESFPTGSADKLNWIFCSTAGRHGSYKTLDEIETIIRGKDEGTAAFENGKYTVTVMIVHPRLCIVKYGEIQVGLSDVALLRRLVASTLEEVVASQEGNV